jgi:hypothetical protein
MEENTQAPQPTESVQPGIEQQVQAPNTDQQATAPPQLSAEAQQYNYEREMFVKGAQGSMDLPGNFKDFGDYFDSLKEAQGQYTQARQEISALKAQMATDALAQPAPEVQEGEQESYDGFLNIPDPAEVLKAKALEDLQYASQPREVTQEMTDAWSQEYVQNQGQFTSETLEAIKQSFPGVSDDMIYTFYQGMKSIEQQNVNKAVEVAGSPDKLKEVIAWAADNLSAEERVATNEALQGPGSEYVLRGLMARYEADSVSMRAEEPQQVPGRVANASAVEAIQGFVNPQEMNAAMRDSRYVQDPEYRAFVSQRLARTSWLTNGGS